MITLSILLLLTFAAIGFVLAAPLVRKSGVLAGAAMGAFALVAVLSVLAFKERAVILGSFEAGPLTALAAFLLSLAAFFVAWGYLVRGDELWGGPGEFVAFLTFAVLGGVLLVGARTLLLFYLGLELSSYATYVLAAYDRDRKESAEGAMKYLVLGALSSAILLYGFALVYAGVGSIEFAAISRAFAAGGSGVALVGLLLALVGLGFKLALVPFHAWVPDAYQGARPVAAAFLASAPKVAVALGIATLFTRAFGPVPEAERALFFLGLFSLVFGNLWALAQENIKRLLAYSTVGHMGYLALLLALGGEFGYSAAAFYLLAYLLAAGGAFFALEAAEAAGVEATLEGWRGLYRRAPMLAALAAVAFLSLAGVPGLAGFMAKLYVFAALAGARMFAALVLAVVFTVVGYAYYFRVLEAAFAKAPKEEGRLKESPTLLALLFVLAFLSLLFGLWPSGAFALFTQVF